MVYHRELTRTGRHSQQTPGRSAVHTGFFFWFFLQFQQRTLMFSPGLNFFFFFLRSLTAVYFSPVLDWHFVLKQLKFQYVFVSECVCVYAHGCSRLFVLVHSRNCPCSTNTLHLSQQYHQFRSTLGLWVASQPLNEILICSVVDILT